MSQKNLRRKRKGTARAMPVETIITRFKSAQQKQQPPKQYKSNKSKIQMRSKNQTTLQSQTTPIKNTVKQVVDEKANKSTEILKEIEQNEEYYPQKLKRTLPNKKIVLMPKCTYRLIGSLKTFNKRKLRIPNKEIIYPKETDKICCTMKDCDIFDKSETSIMDNISIDSDSLDEEDLLEILTCPSPVWWEDPPDDYDEEPITVKNRDADYSIVSKKQTKLNEMVNEHYEFNKISLQKEQNDFTGQEFAISIINKDRNFVTKRNKLEVLLGNLKNKTVNVTETVELKKNIDYNRSNNSSPVYNRQKKNSESCDEELLDENYDDILRSFENIDIPIKNTSPEIKKINKNEGTNSVTKPKSAIQEMKFVNKIMSPLTNIKPVKGITIAKDDIKKFKPSKKNEIPNRVGRDITIKKNKMLVIKKLSDYCDMKIVKRNDSNLVLSRTEKKTFSNKEHKSVTGLSTSNWEPQLMKPGNKNLITYNKKINLNNNKDEKISKLKTSYVNDKSNESSMHSINEKSEDNSLDHVTVYQIVSEQEGNSEKNHVDPQLDLNNEYNSQLSSYYNQCKNINKNSKETVNARNKLLNSSCDVNSGSVKSISVSDNETVKYCLQCSSIFDTETCKYCAKRLKTNAEEHSKPIKLSEKL